MALFSKKKEDQKAESGEASKAVAPVAVPTVETRDLSAVLLRPLITEKAAVLGDKNVYTFEIHPQATKYDVRDAVVALFKVTPVKIGIVWNRPHTYTAAMRGRRGTRAGTKKAYIYLKQGDRIDLV